MELSECSLNTIWARLIVEELIRHRIDYFCIAPGSRSTPLTAAVAHHPKARYRIHFDERGCAFHALGYARATGKPAVLISTSGTALANYFPAVIEASIDQVPMLLLTADRPPELYFTGANQTIDQQKMYGDYVRWFTNMPPPSEQAPPSMVLTTIDQAIYQALRSPAGPVHLNWMFREPLAPEIEDHDYGYYLSDLKNWQKSGEPYTNYTLPTWTPNDHDIQEVVTILNRSTRGLIVAGRLNARDRLAVLELAHELHWPVWPDITSGLRLGTGDEENIVHYFDQLLLISLFKNTDHPQTILHVGGQITSKRFLQYLQSAPLEHYIRVKNNPFRHDPAHRTTLAIEMDPGRFCATIAPQLTRYKVFGWIPYFRQLSENVDDEIENWLNAQSELSEIAVARAISRYIPELSGLFLASSMLIREMDMYGAVNGPIVYTSANRGASGIDGTIASACGFAAGLDRPVTLLIGDLAFLHDLNSLALVAQMKQQLLIVVINNHGGGIFNFLPIAEQRDIFDEFFGTPHPFDMELAARQFGLAYVCPKTLQDFRKSYRQAAQTGETTVIEVVTDRDLNFQHHQALQTQIQTVCKTALNI